MFAVFCFWNPTFASIIINQGWSFYIAPLDLLFKPWRLFMIVCGIPSLVCGLVMLFFMPESPKFTFSHGDEAETIKTLTRIHNCNSGKESYKVKSLVRDHEFNEGCEKHPKNFFQFMWSQTVPLFKHPHLKNTLTACFIQFSIFNTSNGFWTFFPEIANRIALWRQSNTLQVSATVCEVLNSTKIFTGLNGTLADEALCITKLEPSTYENAYMLNCIYFFGWLFLALIINRVGKLIIIVTLLFVSGGCGFALIFVSNPTVSSYLYLLLLADGLALTVLNASTVELFPTRLRCVSINFRSNQEVTKLSKFNFSSGQWHFAFL